MSYQTAKTIKNVIQEIENNKYLLPAIQREFVWKTEQIERLFDSLMNDYPINSFLFWSVKGINVKQYEFYKFLKNYHELNNKHNEKISTDGKEEIIAILDGQQRLTSLYIALKGSYTYKLPRMRYGNPLAYPKRKMYVNLIDRSKKADSSYDFRFLTDEEASKRDEAQYWFRVGDILNYNNPFEINTFVFQNLFSLGSEKAQLASEILSKLYHIVHEKGIISYYLEEAQELDKVLNIFIRINSGGSILSYSDLLLSIATAQWKDYDAREEINMLVDDLNSIGDGFNFNKDFVLKTSLVLSERSNILFKVDNFNKENMLRIERQWDEIKRTLILAVELVSSFGYSRDTLTSNNAIIPIAYYIKKNGLENNLITSSKYKIDREEIRKWLLATILKKSFGGNSDAHLVRLRDVISRNPGSFPRKEIIDEFKGDTHSINFTEADIDNLLDYEYGKAVTFSVLQVLYPNLDYKNKFHVDHIFPKSHFTKSKLKRLGISDNLIEDYIDKVNRLANLQLLDGHQNIEKSDRLFDKWLDTQFNEVAKKDYINKHYIPEVNLKIDNFLEFIDERENLMKIFLENKLLE